MGCNVIGIATQIEVHERLFGAHIVASKKKFPAVPNLDPVDGGRLGLCAPFYPILPGGGLVASGNVLGSPGAAIAASDVFHSSIGSPHDGTEGWLSLFRQPSNAIAAVFSPRGATGGGGVSHHSASPVLTKCSCEDAITRPAYGCPLHGLRGSIQTAELSQQIDRDLAARKRIRLARRK